MFSFFISVIFAKIILAKQVQIEDASAKNLDVLIESDKQIAVLWQNKNCKTCQRAIELLENRLDDISNGGIYVLKINDKQMAKEYGIRNFPSLSLFRQKSHVLYNGNILDESKLLNFLLLQNKEQTLKIDQLTVTELDNLVSKNKYVAVFFYEPNDILIKSKFERDSFFLNEMKKNNLTVVKSSNMNEARKYGISTFPGLLLCVNKVPIIFRGNITQEQEVYEWLFSKTAKLEAPNNSLNILPLMVSGEQITNFEASNTDYSSENNIVMFLYENDDKISQKIINGLKNIEKNLKKEDIDIMSKNIAEVKDIQVSNPPTLLYIKSGFKTIYEGNLLNEAMIQEWIEIEYKSNQDVIEEMSDIQIQDILENNYYVLVFSYLPENDACEEALKQIEQIDDETDAIGVKFVKTKDESFFQSYGLEKFPSIIYFEDKNPSIYDGDINEETELLTWVLYQMKEDTIENINREILLNMIDGLEFLAVFFYDESENSTKVLRHLELIDVEASEFGVRIVKINDKLMSKKYGHRSPPGLGYFRKGNYVKFEGDLFDDEEVLDWLTDPNVMEISDQIEKVNKKMFEKLITRNEFLTVFFYSDSDCKQCSNVLNELENIDDDAEVAGIPIVKLENFELAKSVGVFSLPSIVFFRNFGQDAIIYTGDIKKEENILEWMLIQKDPFNEAIKDKTGEEINELARDLEYLAVFLYQYDENMDSNQILSEIENIDDDLKRQKILLVKSTDLNFSEENGIENFPALIFFKEGVPSLYEGNIIAIEEVLDWLIEMKVESHIELINRPMLTSMIKEIQYVAVLFYKQNCRTCDQISAELEKIDNECDMYGIQLVKLKDPQLAKRYGIRTFPSLVYFRNGNPLTFEGDLKVELSVLEWLTDDDNRELDDEIEEVNNRMLDKLLESSPLIAVFFYDTECVQCDIILDQMEKIDDEADQFGIDFVKNSDPHAARQYNIYNTPALVYFRKMDPVVYDGDMFDEIQILDWLTSQNVFETKNDIEEVNRRMLEKLLDENEFMVVYFFENDCNECDQMLSKLENIDDEVDALDITFVKVNDPRYAKKYGVVKIPSLVYFRRKFPSIFRESLSEEKDVLQWISSNRYKQLELGVFMYAVVLLGILFVGYTVFLLFGLRQTEVERKKEE